MSDTSVLIGLSAVIVSVQNGEPCVFIVKGAQHGALSGTKQAGENDALPLGAFDPDEHRTLEIGLRSWVNEQTPLDPGYVEQLYTFGNRGRYAGIDDDGNRVISVGYLALVHNDKEMDDPKMFWGKWYEYFPWEDWRQGRPKMLDAVILPALRKWTDRGSDQSEIQHRKARLNLHFGDSSGNWNDENTLKRYELLYEARLVPEALRDKGIERTDDMTVVPGRMMAYDHRRILATAMGRVRAKIKYRPVVFELMPESFTLLELQRTVEAIGGHLLHKQNFRRLVDHAGLVEETGETTARSGGRPASLFRFRQDVVMERMAPGVRMSPTRA